MSTLTEAVVLPVGLELHGVLHRNVLLRPQKVRDSIEAMQDERAQADESWLGLVLQARQIVSFGTLNHDQIKPDLLLDLYDVDMQALMEGAAKLRERLKIFRNESQATAQNTGGAA